MHTAQPRHAEDKRQLMEEICHTAEEIRQTSERLCEMAATTQQMSRVAVQMSQVARQKRKETLNEERKTYKNYPPPESQSNPPRDDLSIEGISPQYCSSRM